MKTTSMKYSEADKKRKAKSYEAGPATAASMDDYPYGLVLRLDPEMCKKLGITRANLPRPGTTVTLEGAGYVKSANVELGDKDDDSPEVCIQITDLGFEEDPKERKKRKEADHLDSIAKKTN